MMSLQDEQIIEIIGGHHLFLIIPSDENASVTVNKLRDYDGDIGYLDEVLYVSESGEPFLLRCNVDESTVDNEICISETDGDVYGWHLNVLPDGRIFDPLLEIPVYYDLIL